MTAASASSRAEPETPGLVRAIGVLRERWVVVLLAVVTCLLVALVLTLRATKEYTATAKLHFGQNALITEVGGTAPSPSTDPQADQATNLLLVTTGQVAAAVKSSLKLNISISHLLSKVSAGTDQSSNIVDVSATDADPKRAAAIANAFADQFVATSKRANVAKVLAGENLVNSQLKALPATPANAANRANLESALQKLVVLAAVQTGDASVADYASPPSSPSTPNKKVNLVVALVLGLALGVGLAFLLNLLDRRLKEVEDIEEAYGMTALATIPLLHRHDVTHPESPAAEQFLILRTALSVLTPRGDARTILVTSAVPGEGKTSVAIGLAQAAASAGQTVILVETDFKRPALATRLGVTAESDGLAAALVEGIDPGSLLRAPLIGLPNLFVLTSGMQPPNSAAMLRGPEMGRVLEQLSAEADLLVLDSPPLLPVADAQALLELPQLDAYLIVARENFTQRDEARYTRQRLERRKLYGLGLVVNGVRQVAGGELYYGPTRPGRQPRSGRLGVGAGAGHDQG